MNKRIFPLPKKLLLIAPLILVVLGLIPRPSEGNTEGRWLSNGRSDDFQAYCDASFGGTVCHEWCESFGTVPTGNFCCIGPSSLRSEYPAGPYACPNPVPK